MNDVLAEVMLCVEEGTSNPHTIVVVLVCAWSRGVEASVNIAPTLVFVSGGKVLNPRDDLGTKLSSGTGIE
jgi:hypothetical protein